MSDNYILEFAIYHVGYLRQITFADDNAAFSSMMLDHLTDCMERAVSDDAWTEVFNSLRNRVSDSVRNYILGYASNILNNYIE